MKLAFAATAIFAVVLQPVIAAVKTVDINQAHIVQLIQAISCLPHEPETTSSAKPADAIAAGDRNIGAGHCQAAIADYQVAIDANNSDASALWHQQIVAMALLGQSGDEKIVADAGERAYRDADLAVTAEPKNPIPYVLRAESREILIPLHARKRGAFSFRPYVEGELKNSYDDDTSAITLAPNFGQAYASRYIIDLRRKDEEQANYDLAQAQKYDPEAAEHARSQYERGQRIVDAAEAARACRMLATTEAAFGFAAAANGYVVVGIPPTCGH